MKKLKEITLLFIVLLLTGCAHLNGEFTCPMTGGIHCESLDSVNNKVDHNEIQGVQEVSALKIIPVSSPSKPLHIWIAPYHDREGSYHLASHIYAVSSNSKDMQDA